MTYTGTVVEGKIVLDDDQRLPDGSHVAVEVLEPEVRHVSLKQRLMALAGTVDDLPADMARNHDHYIHGSGKR